METITFNQLNLSNEVLKAVEAMGFKEPSPIQKESIPILMEGHDFLGQAKTGTGKKS